MEGFLTILALTIFGFICFCIYFIFKILQFVIQAINLYKDMVVRQDAMLKILKDIRDNTSGENKHFSPDNKVTNFTEGNNVNTESSNYKCPNCGFLHDSPTSQCLGCKKFM